jgi:hypothetical protein
VRRIDVQRPVRLLLLPRRASAAKQHENRWHGTSQRIIRSKRRAIVESDQTSRNDAKKFPG